MRVYIFKRNQKSFIFAIFKAKMLTAGWSQGKYPQYFIRKSKKKGKHLFVYLVFQN